jgi:hypothetical protein
MKFWNLQGVDRTGEGPPNDIDNAHPHRVVVAGVPSRSDPPPLPGERSPNGRAIVLRHKIEQLLDLVGSGDA